MRARCRSAPCGRPPARLVGQSSVRNGAACSSRAPPHSLESLLALRGIGGVPIEILYDRMKTAVTGEDDEGHIVYNRSLIALAKHFGFLPRACRPYRAKTKGKVERPFSYIRQDFFLGRSFRNLDDLNGQLADWLDTVANVRLHGTTQRIVSEAFAAEKPDLQP